MVPVAPKKTLLHAGLCSSLSKADVDDTTSYVLD